MTNDNQYWAEKYKRENWAMPFGSMCNAYGQIHNGRPLTEAEPEIDKFIKDMKKIYKLSRKLIAESLEPEWETVVKPEPPAEIKKVQEFLNNIPNKTSAQYEVEAEQEDKLNIA